MLKRYDTYKNSEVEWIGEMPEHWKLKRIKHTTYVKGRIGWQGLRSDEFLEIGDCYVVTGTDFDNGKINWKTCYQITQSRYDEDPFIQLKENDLLITKDGTIGKIALVKNIPGIATLNSGIFVTRPKTNDYLTEFMFWVLQSEIFTSFINHNKSGSTILHLYQNVFNEFRSPCPLLEEQTQIAQYLDHKTSQIDKLIADKEKLIELLNEERTAIINQAVTKGLNPDVPMKDSGIEWLGEVPEHWGVKKLKYLIASISGGGTPSTDNPEYWGGDIPWVSPKDMKVPLIKSTVDNITEQALKDSSTQLIDKHTLLLVVRSGILKRSLPLAINQVPVALNQDMKALTTNDLLSTDYLYWMLNGMSDLILTQCKKLGSTVDSLDMVAFLNFELVVPEQEEQNAIIVFIIKELSRIDKLCSTTRQEIQLLKEYKTALISEVVTGKVDVRDEVIAESTELVS